VFVIEPNGQSLRKLYSMLRRRFGFLNWWPAETKDEMVIGAILTQNTSWKNVEKAIANLKRAKKLSLKALAQNSSKEIPPLIKPSGFYKQKAERLHALASYLILNYGSLQGFFKKSKNPRGELLAVKGIGRETADSILLYAGNLPVFVVDAYTCRILGRFFGKDYSKLSYDALQAMLQNELKGSALLYQDFHAQIVELAKHYCRKQPLCSNCPLVSDCAFASTSKTNNSDILHTTKSRGLPKHNRV